MYKVKDRYEGSMLSLNLIEAHHYRRVGMGMTDILFLLSVVVLIALAGTLTMLPDTSFLAQCQNIPGGDVCTINIQ